MRNLFKEATFWELTNILWWISVILVGIFGIIWYRLISKIYYYIINSYFLKFRIKKKSDEWCREVVKNFEMVFKTGESREKLKNSNPNYKCYMYCKNRLNENSK